MAELVPQTTELQLWILWCPDISPQCWALLCALLVCRASCVHTPWRTWGRSKAWNCFLNALDLQGFSGWEKGPRKVTVHLSFFLSWSLLSPYGKGRVKEGGRRNGSFVVRWRQEESCGISPKHALPLLHYKTVVQQGTQKHLGKLQLKLSEPFSILITAFSVSASRRNHNK